MASKSKKNSQQDVATFLAYDVVLEKIQTSGEIGKDKPVAQRALLLSKATPFNDNVTSTHAKLCARNETD